MSVVRVPSSRYRLDERDAYGQSLAAKLDYGLFVVQLGGLGNNNIEILLHAGYVAVVGDGERMASRGQGGYFFVQLVRQIILRGQLILHILICRQHGLPVSRHGGVIGGFRHSDLSAAFARIETPKGPIEKTMRFYAHEPRIDFDIAFHWDDWGKGSLRLGHVSLLPGAFDWDNLSLTTHNGGKTCETFALGGATVDHGAPVSFLVSASHGLGMTEGWAEIGDFKNRIRVTVDRATAPLLGLLTHRALRGGTFCQFVLSALELDDTRKPSPLTSGPKRFRFSVNASFPSGCC